MTYDNNKQDTIAESARWAVYKNNYVNLMEGLFLLAIQSTPPNSIPSSSRPLRLYLSTHDESHKLLVVHVALRVLLVRQQLLHLVIGQLLAQSRQQVSQFSRRNEATGVLVKVPQALNKVVGRVVGPGLGDRLVDRQEHLEGDALVRLQLVRALEHIRLGRVLAQSTQTLAYLVQLDLAIAAGIKQVEGLLEFCG